MINKKRQSRRNSKIRENFVESLKYLKESKKYFYIISLIFLVGILIGSVFYSQLYFLDDLLRELMEKFGGLGLFGLVGAIFLNNIVGAFFGLFLGLFLGIFSIVNIFFNGLLLGYVMKLVVIGSGIHELWRILPYGIFELPAIIISFGLGLKLGMFIFFKDVKGELLNRLKKSFFVFIFVVLPLLIVAAIIEGLLIFLFK